MDMGVGGGLRMDVKEWYKMDIKFNIENWNYLSFKVYQKKKKINVTILWEILNLNQSDVYFLLISFGLQIF